MPCSASLIASAVKRAPVTPRKSSDQQEHHPGDAPQRLHAEQETQQRRALAPDIAIGEITRRRVALRAVGPALDDLVLVDHFPFRGRRIRLQLLTVSGTRSYG